MHNGSGGLARSSVVAAAARALGVGMWPTFVDAVPGSWVCVEDDVAAFDSGTDTARFNAVAAPVPDTAPGTVGRLVEALAARTDWFSLRPQEMERHVDVWARGFGVPPEALDPWLRSDLLDRPNVMAYQASVDGADVATALGIVADGFVGVFNVACVESHRRRGYGAALTAKVVLDGLSSGAEMAVLTSSPLGEGTYRALGFREVARWAQWLPEDIGPD